MRKKAKIWFIFLALIMLVAVILSIPFVGDKIGPGVTNVARTVAGIAIGLFLISAGVSALSVPVVGIAMIIVGVALVAYSVWPLFSTPKIKRVE